MLGQIGVRQSDGTLYVPWVYAGSPSTQVAIYPPGSNVPTNFLEVDPQNDFGVEGIYVAPNGPIYVLYSKSGVFSSIAVFPAGSIGNAQPTRIFQLGGLGWLFPQFVADSTGRVYAGYWTCGNCTPASLAVFS